MGLLYRILMCTILFDFDQTLVFSYLGFRRADTIAQNYIYDYLVNHGYDSTENVFALIYKAVSVNFQAIYKYDRTLWWENIITKLGFSVNAQLKIELKKLETIYWDTVERYTILFPETLSTLEILKSDSNIKMGIISDTDGVIGRKKQRITKIKELNSFFNIIVISGENGLLTKPFKDPFFYALKYLNSQPGQPAYYVGDNYELDIKGALDAKLKPLWFKHNWIEQMSNEQDYKPNESKIHIKEILTKIIDNI